MTAEAAHRRREAKHSEDKNISKKKKEKKKERAAKTTEEGKRSSGKFPAEQHISTVRATKKISPDERGRPPPGGSERGDWLASRARRDLIGRSESILRYPALMLNLFSRFLAIRVSLVSPPLAASADRLV